MYQHKPMRLKYSQSITVVMLWLSLLVALCPAWFVGQFISTMLGITGDSPIKEQENGWLWATLFLLEFLVFVTLSYVFWSLVCGRLNGWSTQKSLNVFIKFNYPKHWYREKVT